MRSKRSIGSKRLALAAGLAIGCAGIAWLAIGTTAVETLPPIHPALARLAPHDPDRLLGAEMIAFVLKRGRLDAADNAAIADAAASAPLDARSYMLVAAQRSIRGDKQPIVPLLEAGRRLDPRQTWIRLYLLDQYLRTGRYAQAATEFAVLNRLVGGAGDPIVAELARMSTDPAMAGGVRAALARDPVMENAVLTKLAASGVAPAQIFAIASPAARAAAGSPGGWGAALASGLVAKQRYQAAYSVWQRIYGVAGGGTSPYDGSFKGLAGSAPFNWTFDANEIGAADRSSGSMAISYYGRQAGELANQLLLLPPGQYQLSYALSGPAPSNGGPTLAWTVACDQHESPLLLDGAMPAATEQQRIASLLFTVPANCPAQWLRVTGDPGQFPATMTATIRDVIIRPVRAKS